MPTHRAHAADLSAVTHGGPDEQERYISQICWHETLETVADGARLDSPSSCALYRSASMLPSILGTLVLVGRVYDAALPTWFGLHR